jgi:hypothetical protein
MAATTSPRPPTYWFVNAWLGSQDFSEEFINGGFWENRLSENRSAYSVMVQEMAPGDQIALKIGGQRPAFVGAVVRHSWFQTIAIAATGTVIANVGDGIRANVEWTREPEPRVWSFYTNYRLIWKVVPSVSSDPDFQSALVAFAFDHEPQRVYSWLALPDLWRNRAQNREQRGSLRADVDFTQFAWAWLFEDASFKLREFVDPTIRKQSLSAFEGLLGRVTDYDPFTVMASWNRQSFDVDMRRDRAMRVKDALKLRTPLPEHFAGVATVDGNSRFCTVSPNPDAVEVEVLWRVFDAAFEYLFRLHGPDPRQEFIEAYDRAVALPGVGWNLTTGLSWATPWEFPPLDRETRALIAERYPDLLPLGVDGPVLDGAGYVRLVETLHPRDFTPQTMLVSFPALVAEAHKEMVVSTFEKITTSLQGSGLYVPSETLATYFLALQAKRFVILSGISGTGKTRIATEVAKALGAFTDTAPKPDLPTEPPLNSDTDYVDVIVRPSMLDQKSMVIPRRMRALLPVTASREVRLTFDGRHENIYLYFDSVRDVAHLMFRRVVGAWFRETFMIDDRFRLRIVGADDPDTAEIELVPLIAGGVPVAFPESSPPLTFIPDVARQALIAVRPDWTDNRSVLGYFNPLHQQYQPTVFLKFLLDARDEVERAERAGGQARPFFAIFDEMNLARVEHYFSDFLSALESGDAIDLHDDEETVDGGTDEGISIPRRLTIPPNVYFTGTVNVDETTHMFSPKVLDRAFVIEFDEVNLEAYGRMVADPGDGAVPDHVVALPQFTGIGGEFRSPDSSDWEAFGDLDGGRYRQALIELHTALKKFHRHFGYRVANEIARFVVLADTQSDGPMTADAFDIAVVAKVLPKFHGTRRDVEEPLKAVFQWAIDGSSGTRTDRHDDRNWVADSGTHLSFRAGQTSRSSTPATGTEAETLDATAPRPDTGSATRYARTAMKAWRMLRRLDGGFTSFME